MFSSAWYLLWNNHGCFILLSIFPVLDHLPSFISSSQLEGLLVANTWKLTFMKDMSQWAGHGLDHLPMSSMYVDSQGPSGRKGPQEVSGPRRVRAEFKPCCKRPCPQGCACLGLWKPPRWWPYLGNFLLPPRRPGCTWCWQVVHPKQPSQTVTSNWRLGQHYSTDIQRVPLPLGHASLWSHVTVTLHCPGEGCLQEG